MPSSASLPPPAVALVPGFFGFDHRGDSTYFADRFVAGLRSVLEAHGLPGIPVVSVSTLGIAGLRQRQDDLLRELQKLETGEPGAPRLGGPRTWHLVGHSTGGVDAALLGREQPLQSPEAEATEYAACGWGDWTGLVHRVASITTIAAPHFGTGLAESPLAKFAGGRPSLVAFWNVAQATADVARRGDLGSRIAFAMGATPSLAKMPYFLLQMAFMNQLARDLRPSVLGPLSSAPLRADLDGRVYSVVTVAPRPERSHPDKLFRDLWQWTHDGMGRVRAAAPPAPIDSPTLRLPSQRSLALPPIDAGDSDGIVSTVCQTLGEPIALVVGDHVDVLGRYRRASLADGKVIDPGLLTSGAEFGDDEFFALLLRVGQRLAAVM